MPVSRFSIHSARLRGRWAWALLVGLPFGLAQADPPVAASAESIRPVAVGARAPGFVVRNVAGEPYAFAADALERPTILVSFRGGWCPYCNLHLSELRHVLPEIRALGVDVLFLSGDRPEQLYKSLEEDTKEAIAGRDYRIFSDARAEAARALGIAFRVADRTVARRHEKGQDIAGSSMLEHRILPVPAVIAIDRNGIVRFVFAAADYKIRLPAADLLAVAESIAAG